MSLMPSKKMNLLQELVELSNDEEIIPYIDEETASRIKEILEKNQSLNFLEEYQDLAKDFNKIKSKTEMDEINELYHQNFPNLFEEDSSLALKEISVGLSNNKKPMSKSNTQSQINKKIPSNNQDQNHIKSLGSTCSKFNTLKFNETNKENLFDKKKSKEKLISYKIGKETPKFNKNSQSSSKITKINSTEKTPQKRSISKINSKSNLKLKEPHTNVKRSESQKSKFNTRSMSSSVKQENFSALKNSESKTSLLSTNKIKSKTQKKSMEEMAKRQIKSFSSVENYSEVKKSMTQSGFRERSKSKDNNRKKDMLKKINRLNTEFSAEEKMKKGPSFFGENEDNYQQSQIIDKNSQKGSRIFTEIPNENIESEEELLSSIDCFGSRNYLKEIIIEIYSQQNEKIEEKEKLEEHIAKLKEKISAENRRLQETTNKNNKLIREIDTLSEFQKSVSQERQLIQKSLYEVKRKVKSLKQSLSEKSKILKNMIENEIKEEQEVIEMYENVIDELRKEIREQNRKKNEIKGCLEKSHKKLETKEIRFNSTLISTKKIKHDLTDAFKEWL